MRSLKSTQSIYIFFFFRQKNVHFNVQQIFNFVECDNMRTKNVFAISNESDISF